ncbi:unnamed protein product [Chrysoparadoxa australica]
MMGGDTEVHTEPATDAAAYAEDQPVLGQPDAQKHKKHRSYRHTRHNRHNRHSSVQCSTGRGKSVILGGEALVLPRADDTVPDKNGAGLEMSGEEGEETGPEAEAEAFPKEIGLGLVASKEQASEPLKTAYSQGFGDAWRCTGVNGQSFCQAIDCVQAVAEDALTRHVKSQEKMPRPEEIADKRLELLVIELFNHKPYTPHAQKRLTGILTDATRRACSAQGHHVSQAGIQTQVKAIASLLLAAWVQENKWAVEGRHFAAARLEGWARGIIVRRKIRDVWEQAELKARTVLIGEMQMKTEKRKAAKRAAALELEKKEAESAAEYKARAVPHGFCVGPRELQLSLPPFMVKAIALATKEEQLVGCLTLSDNHVCYHLQRGTKYQIRQGMSFDASGPALARGLSPASSYRVTLKVAPEVVTSLLTTALENKLDDAIKALQHMKKDGQESMPVLVVNTPPAAPSAINHFTCTLLASAMALDLQDPERTLTLREWQSPYNSRVGKPEPYISLRWEAVETNGLQLTCYSVERSICAANDHARSAWSIIAHPNKPEHVDAPLRTLTASELEVVATPGALLCYRVYASNRLGDSPPTKAAEVQLEHYVGGLYKKVTQPPTNQELPKEDFFGAPGFGPEQISKLYDPMGASSSTDGNSRLPPIEDRSSVQGSDVKSSTYYNFLKLRKLLPSLR